MEMDIKRSRSKLWVGFGLMSVAILGWVFAIKWLMVSMDSITADMAANASKVEPLNMMSRLMLGYGLVGITFLGGVVVTVLGCIDYAAEVRRRG